MKITLELPDPKFQVGDVVRYMIGPENDVPVVFAISYWEFSGSWSHDSYRGETVDVGWGRDCHDAYTIVAQEDVTHEGREWIYKRMVLCPKIEDLEARAEKIDWEAPILPAADLEFYDEKWKTPKTNHTES
jgi:hypothetical protein